MLQLISFSRRAKLALLAFYFAPGLEEWRLRSLETALIEIEEMWEDENCAQEDQEEGHLMSGQKMWDKDTLQKATNEPPEQKSIRTWHWKNSSSLAPVPPNT